MKINKKKYEEQAKKTTIKVVNSLSKGKQFLSPKETSVLMSKLGLKVSERTLYKMIKNNEGPKSQMVHGKRVYTVNHILSYVINLIGGVK